MALLARTASQGAKVRAGMEPNPQEVKQAMEINLERRESRKLERKNSRG